jgi:hypothetical protein
MSFLQTSPPVHVPHASTGIAPPHLSLIGAGLHRLMGFVQVTFAQSHTCVIGLQNEFSNALQPPQSKSLPHPSSTNPHACEWWSAHVLIFGTQGPWPVDAAVVWTIPVVTTAGHWFQRPWLAAQIDRTSESIPMHPWYSGLSHQPQPASCPQDRQSVALQSLTLFSFVQELA